MFKSILRILVFSEVVYSFGISHTFAQTQVGIDKEDYFENVSSLQRSEILANSQISIPDYRNMNQTVDVVDELNKSCKGFAIYSRNASGEIIKPTVNCKYVPDPDLDGMTPKFKCEFTKDTGKTKKLKIKYSKSLGSSGKEIATGFVGSTLTRLLGFKSEAFCPAIVNCEGCADDPWDKNSPDNQFRSSKPAIPGKKEVFPFALIEVKLDGWKVSIPRTNQPKPIGFAWDELKLVNSQRSEVENRQTLIEREAYMLWINFINHTDADAHNNRIVCEKVAPQDVNSIQKNPVCVQSTAIVHDFGDSFNWMRLDEYANRSVLRGRRRCVGTLEGGEGIIAEAEYSEEARIDFLNRASKINKLQLVDIFRLADVSGIDGYSNPNMWSEVILEKIDQVRNAKCQPFSNGDSVLNP